MKPHTRLLTDAFNLVLYEMGRYLRPRPDWHTPDHSSCWLWRGPMVGEARMQRHRKFNYQGSTTYLVNHKGVPSLNLGSKQRIDVRHFMFHLYRSPERAVSSLKQICHSPTCVNPWHYEPRYQDSLLKSNPWPQTSPLNTLPDYLAGVLAQDTETLKEREENRLYERNELIQELNLEYKLIPLNEIHKETTDAKHFKKPEAEEVEEIHPWARNYWLVDRMTGLPYAGRRVQYDCEWDYVYTLKKWFPELTADQLSPELRALLKWYSLRIPDEPLTIRHNSDYFIGRHELGDGFSILEEAVQMKISTGFEILSLDKKVHAKLVIMKIKELLNHEILKIDWTK